MRSFPILACCSAAAIFALVACDANPASPIPSSYITFEFAGTIDQSCNVIGAQACDAAPFGSGIPMGTQMTGRFSLDPATPPTVVLKTDTYAAVRYPGVIVNMTVGSVALAGNDAASTYLEIDSLSTLEQDVLTIPRGFPSGRVAGLSVDFAQVGLRVVPTRFPDVSLIEDASLFQAGLGITDGASVAIKHHSDPNFGVFGIVAPGPLASGPITSIGRR